MGERLALTGLPDGDLFVGIRAADESGNWSELSNVARRTALAAPDPIVDLAIVSTGVLSTTLTWTVPAATEERILVNYDIRYHDMTITDANWAEARVVGAPPGPRNPGEQERFSVWGLERATSYYFAVRSQGDIGQSSLLSNVVSTTTAADSEVRLTSDGGKRLGANSSDWSPDGESIVFYSDRHGFDQIYLYTLATGVTTQITSEPDGVRSPRWSPDGSVLSVAASGRDGKLKLALLNPSPGSVPRTIVAHSGQSVIAHAWSPDGTRIAYYVVRQFSPVVITDLYVVPSDGGSPELVLEGWTIRGGAVDWTADGQSVLFPATQNNNPDIWMVSAGGGEPSRLTSDPGDDFGPRLSPDGQTILFSSDRAGSHDLWEIPASGGTATQLTTDSRTDYLPAPSPDGLKIAFTRSSGSVEGIWILYRN